MSTQRGTRDPVREESRVRWRRKARRLGGLLQLVPTLLLAQQQGSIQQLFPARPTGYLTDGARIVDQSSAARIEDLAARLRTATSAELAVVTLPTIGRYEPSEVALAIGRAWGVGNAAKIGDQRRNAGMVLLLVPRADNQSGKIYLATGQGIEGIITDATAGRITDLMIPALRDASYGPALVTGTEAIAALVAKGFGVTDSALTAADPFKGDSGGDEGGNAQLVFFIVVILVLVVLPAILRARGGGGRGGRGGRGGGGFWGPIIGSALGGGWGGGGFGGGFGGGGGGGGFGGFGGGGGFSGGGGGRSF